MCIKTTALVFFFASGVCISSTLDFLDVNLLDEVKTTSPPLIFRGGSTESVTISWLHKPPYIFDDKRPENENRPAMLQAKKARGGGVANESKDDMQERGEDNKTDNSAHREGDDIKGIFQEIVSKGFQICGRIAPENVNYTIKAKDLQRLDDTIVKKEVDVAMPVLGSGAEELYGGHTYVEVLKSPGVVFIVNKQQTLELSRRRVLQAMKETWPVVVITLLMAGFAGLLVWGLDTTGNPTHFPHSFTRGVMEGIWWSFVSMTTVGYGDRIPKSLMARLFGILWILTGLILCSFFTATFTSALTSSSLNQRSSLLGVKVAVMADSHAYDEALKQAANVKDYPDFYEMYDALVVKGEVEGILADIYTASFYMVSIDDPRLAVSMFFGTQHSIGFVIGEKNFMMNMELGPCLKDLFKYRQRDVKKIILRHTQAFHTETRNRKLTDEDADDIASVTLLDGDSPGFKTALHTLLITFLLLLTMGFVYETCITKLRDQRLTSPKGCIAE